MEWGSVGWGGGSAHTDSTLENNGELGQWFPGVESLTLTRQKTAVNTGFGDTREHATVWVQAAFIATHHCLWNFFWVWN